MCAAACKKNIPPRARPDRSPEKSGGRGGGAVHEARAASALPRRGCARGESRPGRFSARAGDSLTRNRQRRSSLAQPVFPAPGDALADPNRSACGSDAPGGGEGELRPGAIGQGERSYRAGTTALRLSCERWFTQQQFTPVSNRSHSVPGVDVGTILARVVRRAVGTYSDQFLYRPAIRILDTSIVGLHI